jgi:hypothetical protein
MLLLGIVTANNNSPTSDKNNVVPDAERNVVLDPKIEAKMP